MNKKISILIVSMILTIIVFIISTYMQKKLVNHIPTMKCMIVNKDVAAYEQINEEWIEYVEMPIEIIAKQKIAQNYSDIKELYLKDKLYKGQIVLLNQFDTKENLMIFNAEVGKEKISIKIKASENGASFTIKENSIVNVYATMRNDYPKIGLFDGEVDSIGTEEDGYQIIKLLDSIKILGVFDVNGESIENSSERNIDTILVSVTPKEAKIINLIREIATFNITELGKKEVLSTM
ncbi:MAG: hypothetical protein J6C46_12740 [Clostridia bacterium]|nr:hypothetical protein [Clostridia bacterium]